MPAPDIHTMLIILNNTKRIELEREIECLDILIRMHPTDEFYVKTRALKLMMLDRYPKG